MWDTRGKQRFARKRLGHFDQARTHDTLQSSPCNKQLSVVTLVVDAPAMAQVASTTVHPLAP